MKSLKEIVFEGVGVKYYLLHNNHEINKEEVEEACKSPSALIHYVNCILTDVLQMLALNYPKEAVVAEIEEAKYYLICLAQFLERQDG
ncbi:hypothetical protein DRN86_05215 [Candidatus Geothermarchaeota archaeon]|nr:MAG: hypothetical protein DRN86_05215 [Candidatus Geothermarchaeota archaeon]